MTLDEIIKADAAYLAGVTVNVCRAFSTVDIKDDTGWNKSVFMQGHDADQFIDAYDAMREAAPKVGGDLIELHLAKPYVECAWS